MIRSFTVAFEGSRLAAVPFRCFGVCTMGRNNGKPGKEQKSFEANGLALNWESSDQLRNRLREHGKLMMHPKSQKVAANTIKNAILNVEVLKPAVVRLRASGGKMPAIDDLIAECVAFYQKTGKDVDNDVACKDAWTLRRMLSWLKRKANREEVGKDSLQQLLVAPFQLLLARLLDLPCHV